MAQQTAGQQIAGASPPVIWSRTFPATPAEAGQARRFLAGVLDGCPLTDDAVACLGELVNNAVIHSDSRQPGGTFTVHAELCPARLRVEVRDSGGPWRPVPDDDDEHGRGLAIVRKLAGGYTVTGGEQGRTVAFEMVRP